MVVSSHDGGRSGGGGGADDGCGGRHAGRREVKKYFNYFPPWIFAAKFRMNCGSN